MLAADRYLAFWQERAKEANMVECRDYKLWCCDGVNRLSWECMLKEGDKAKSDAIIYSACPDTLAAAKAAGITSADSPGTCSVEEKAAIQAS